MSIENQDPKVLIVEDTLSMALTYQRHLERAGIPVEITQTGVNAIAMLSSGSISTVLLDLQLPDMNGLEIIKVIKAKKIPVNFIVITANGSVNTAVEAMKKGAYDFLIKPVSAQRLITSVKNGMERSQLEQKVEVLKQDLTSSKMVGFIGSSKPMLAIYKLIETISHSKAPVFITGESGTGKEVCAQAIHQTGPRAKKPFVAINCAAIPDNLMESEIFGHVKGAFTGASEARSGAAKRANGGTLFLDEICEMDINLQAKLLRFLQTGQIKRVGSDTIEDVDVRIVCATNRNPMQEIKEKRFREDLFYRLDVLNIELPPLRVRGNDIVEISEFFIEKFSDEENKNFTEISPEALSQLKKHSWPGNVRELQNMIRKLVILNTGPSIETEMVVPLLKQRETTYSDYSLMGLVDGAGQIAEMKTPVTIDLDRPMLEIEQDIIEAIISSHDNSVPKAAKILGLSPSTIYRKREQWLEAQQNIKASAS